MCCAGWNGPYSLLMEWGTNENVRAGLWYLGGIGGIKRTWVASLYSIALIFVHVYLF